MSAARVAVGTVELHLPDVGSLKGKRHVLEGPQGQAPPAASRSRSRRWTTTTLWQRATLAVACVSGDSRHANEVISKALDYIEDNLDG